MGAARLLLKLTAHRAVLVRNCAVQKPCCIGDFMKTAPGMDSDGGNIVLVDVGVNGYAAG